MLWTRFILLAMMFGVMLSNRFMDNRLIDFSAPYAAAVKNSDAQKVAILESLSNANFMSDLKGPHNELTVLYENNHPYHQINKLNDDSEENDDDFYTLSAHEIIRDKNESNKKSDNHFDSRTEIINLSTQNAAFGINDLKFLTLQTQADSESGSYKFSGFDTTSDAAKRSLPAIDIDNRAYYYEDLLNDYKNLDVKRGTSVSTIGCDCKIKNDLVDLGQRHFPRYLLNAVCQSGDVREPRCWRGICKPLEYKVKVLTFRTVKDQNDPALAWLPDDLRQLWRFKTVTVAAGCFCAVG